MVRSGTHTIFRRPNQIRSLILRGLQNPDKVISQGGRYVIEKQFGREIGRGGETVLRIVVEESGKIVTAYPIQSLSTVIAAGAVLLDPQEVSALGLDSISIPSDEELGIDPNAPADNSSYQRAAFLNESHVLAVIDLYSSRLYGQLMTIEDDYQAALDAAQPSIWEELFWDIALFGLYGGGLNVGEDQMLDMQREVRTVTQAAVNNAEYEIESFLGRQLSDSEVQQLRQMIMGGIGSVSY